MFFITVLPNRVDDFSIWPCLFCAALYWQQHTSTSKTDWIKNYILLNIFKLTTDTLMSYTDSAKVLQLVIILWGCFLFEHFDTLFSVDSITFFSVHFFLIFNHSKSNFKKIIVFKITLGLYYWSFGKFHIKSTPQIWKHRVCSLKRANKPDNPLWFIVKDNPVVQPHVHGRTQINTMII